ncbi:unnamed protein product, partial [Medioppia subpectinata]
MYRYSCDRFPNLLAEYRGAYTCSICQQIFNTPVTTTCCLQTFCEDCITQWLQTNTTCPFDRKPLSKANLVLPRDMLSSLGKLSIKCDYWDSGCREVIKLEDLSQHTVNCRYKSILAECRRHRSVPELLDTGMSTDWTDKTLAIISEQLAKQNNLYLVCKYVVNQMDLEFGSQWHCTAHSSPNSSEYYQIDNDRHLKVKFTPITFMLNWSIFVSRLSLNKFCRKLTIIYTDMKPSMVSWVSAFVNMVMCDAANHRSLSMKATAANIGAKVGEKYRGRKWQCIIYGHGSANYHVTSVPGTYLHCHVDQLIDVKSKIDRFPDLSAEDRDKYTCSICQQIFDCPVTTTCCLQTFCEDCITKWLQTNTTCPYDRKSLNKGELSRAPRVMVNTLGRFNIRCDYCDGGCREVVKLESLSQHTVNCRYKSVKCSTCQCAHILGHDCIEALRAEIEALKMTKNDKATNYYDGGNSSSSNDQSVLSDHKILAECRRHIPAPEVLNTGMSADMTDKTLYIISEQLAKQNSLYLVCKHVVEDMELEFGTDWHCMTDSGRNSVGYYRAVSDRHMTVKFTPVTFNVFYSERLDWTVFKARLKHNKIDR